MLKRGDTITVQGRIDVINDAWVDLHDCELVESPPVVAAPSREESPEILVRNVEYVTPAVMAAHPRTGPTGPARVQPTQGRVFVPPSVTPQYLTAFFDGHTDAQGQRSVADYLGKWMPFQGLVDNVHGYEKRVAVSCHVGRTPASAMPISVGLWFSGKWMQSVELWSQGDQIAIVGRIDNVERFRIDLKDCELTEG
jgi:hypothetical protein